MAVFSQTEAQATLDQRFPTTGSTDYFGFSINGTSEFANLARVAVGATGWAAATAALPSVKANANQINTANATGSGTVSHYAVFTASTGGTQRTIWIPLTTAKPVASGDSLQASAGQLAITLS